MTAAPKLWKRDVLGEKIARAIAPEAWAEFDYSKPKGRMTNMNGWRLLDSFRQSARVLDLLEGLGFPIAKRKPPKRGRPKGRKSK